MRQFIFISLAVVAAFAAVLMGDAYAVDLLPESGLF